MTTRKYIEALAAADVEACEPVGDPPGFDSARTV